MIVLTKHASEKFGVLAERGFIVTKAQVYEALKNPDFVARLDLERFIAQSPLNRFYVIRVVFKRENGTMKVITFYPARKERYKNETKN